jgi:hypothetical protein
MQLNCHVKLSIYQTEFSSFRVNRTRFVSGENTGLYFERARPRFVYFMVQSLVLSYRRLRYAGQALRSLNREHTALPQSTCDRRDFAALAALFVVWYAILIYNLRL